MVFACGFYRGNKECWKAWQGNPLLGNFFQGLYFYSWTPASITRPHFWIHSRTEERNWVMSKGL